jgi:predicted dinucleotide-utilizing enzyme
MQGLPSPVNPKTSMLTAYNIYRSIQALDASIVI